MDQIKTGRFIAAECKRQGRTQRQLAEALGISDKTVSKWECGNGFPEVSLLLPLCQALEVSVNELLTGKRVSDQEYRGKAEDNMVDLVRQTQENRKRLWLSAVTAAAMILVVVPLFVVAVAPALETWHRCILIAAGLVVVAGGIAVACTLDYGAGAFECPVCRARFVPEMRAYLMAPHTLRKRRLRCPQCGAVRYCRHVL